jgi:hypothetical protein
MLVARRLAGLLALVAHYAGIHALTQSPPLDQPDHRDRRVRNPETVRI